MLTERLLKVKKSVGIANKVFDVGCDHGYLPIELVKSGMVNCAAASDVNKGPVENAIRNIKANGLEDKIKAVQGDGFSKMDKDTDVATVAGMGGILISKLLENDIKKVRNLKRIILQPMNNKEYLRRFLYENSFKVEKEVIAVEGKTIYNILVVENGKDNYEKESYFFLGNPDKFEKNSELKKYIDYVKYKAEKVLKSVKGIKEKEDFYNMIIKDAEDFL